MMNETLSPLCWGGLLETLENCEEKDNIPENLKILKEKITFLERTKTIKEIQDGIAFTKEERNYLNSPLLDEIYDTIFSLNPFFRAILKGKLAAARFYAKRTKKFYPFLVKPDLTKLGKRWSKYGSEEKKIECLTILRDNGYDIKKYYFLPKMYAENHEPKLVNFLVENDIMRVLSIDDFADISSRGLPQIVKLLLERMPTEEMPHWVDSEALFQAVLNNSEELVELFLGYGLIPDTETYLSAKETGNERLIKLIEEKLQK